MRSVSRDGLHGRKSGKRTKIASANVDPPFCCPHMHMLHRMQDDAYWLHGDPDFSAPLNPRNEAAALSRLIAGRAAGERQSKGGPEASASQHRNRAPLSPHSKGNSLFAASFGSHNKFVHNL